MRYVNKPVRKKDAMSLVTGKPVYTDDITQGSSLVVKLLRSPHAHALIEEINTERAKKVSGIECVLTYEDVPESRFTTAGQSYPEPSPYDRLILDKRLRCVGDPVAIVAGLDEKSVDKALSLIKVKYNLLEPLLDFRKAKDNEILIHPEDNFVSLVEVGADNKRNLCSSESMNIGNVEEELKKCAHVIEETYHTKANNQTMMETFRTYTSIDAYGRLNVISSTQIPFHVRRILSNALQIPKSQIRVIKPRIGGGFGAKQSVVSELFPAIVTWITKKPAKMIYSRKESFTNGSPRHEAEIKIRLGADENGIIKAIHMYSLWNAGAYGDHGPTTVGLSGHKAMTIYNANAYKFDFDVVYSNTMGAGAYRGYGATQGFFALESAVNELAAKLNMDPTVLRMNNMLTESSVGKTMPTYYNEELKSCTLDKCLKKAKEMISWDEKYPCRDMGNNKVRSVGCAVAMQGSGISSVDVGAVEIRLNDDGFYTLMIGATDMGTGCDTILAQMAADCMDCEYDSIVVHGVDTDLSPYDTGSYASSTTYITGMAVVKACESLKNKIIDAGAKKLGCSVEYADFDGKSVCNIKNNESISLIQLANDNYVGSNNYLSASESHYSPTSPPPFMAGLVEIEVDKLTGKVDIIDYVGVIDCGTVINPNLARVQAEGGIVQAMGMAMYEDIIYDRNGRMLNDSFMQYKIPSRLDVGNIRIDFESSYEPSGPFGAKSIGELVINTPPPAIANAVYNATKVNIRSLPITGEKVMMGMLKNA
ncbi:molybdopterin-dependent oxidoreductase [Sedimentibacter hydroxybenzoicus DSM 7310]|uniref:Molybdopterin-dependent oxidoreductase n=1 Tax=Sedimentibacter hydroxybenzoicus DSM 7310 TaxID=1123245 RepID=A0A974GV15_SEDHY|nr:molybdopterin cofactor-binding domain-containing protein [Sedimentibacter hydroxybenzoicus]NYB72908.1 molybdopterin-dependent oxidoreductase [Sedimentibacter hydroxybenzoicus DSM 7310]